MRALGVNGAGSLNLILFGPPGSGKGTQSSRLVAHYGMTHISTGDALRAAIRNKTEIGMRAQAIMERGALVGDDLVTELLGSIIGQHRETTDSFLFDGYPRTRQQVKNLDELIEEYNLSPPAVIVLDVPDETLILRLTGRRICAHCRAVFNIYFSPARQNGVCDVCAGPLMKRVDDNPETTRERLRVYHEQSRPVLDLYSDRGLLYTIDATGNAEEVFRKINAVIEENY